MHVGVIGGGQLGRMLGLAGQPLGLRFTFLDPGDTPCAASVGAHLQAPFADPDAVSELAARTDVVTTEFENVPAAVLSVLASDPPHPAHAALAAAQERAREKTLFETVGIPVAPWRAAESQADVDAAVADLGLPLIAKTRTLGYDGKGQRRLTNEETAAGVFAELGSVPLLIERLVPFDAELSVIGTRGADGRKLIYPLTRNIHIDGILHRSEQTSINSTLQRQAQKHFSALTDALGYVGTLAIEFFVCDQLLLGNEFAPRVHNSGHWTMDGMPHGQFENHVRAVCGLPLGGGAPIGASGMLNLIGTLPELEPLLAEPGVHLHLYDKAPRPGRKIGHINVVESALPLLQSRLDSLERHLQPDRRTSGGRV